MYMAYKEELIGHALLCTRQESLIIEMQYV